jgi:flagellar basal body-associated protein FliL
MAENTQAPAPAVAAKKKGRGLWKKIALGIVLCLVAAVGAGVWFSMHASAAEAKPAPHGLITFEPFVVNLADGAGAHFLRVTLQLVVENADDAEKVLKAPVQLSELRSAVLECLTQQTASALVTPEGKQALKLALGTRASAVITPAKVTDVLFSEFVVQF